MSTQHVRLARLRTRWSAVGATVAITLGAGGLSMAQAAIDTGDRPVTVSITAERILDTRTNLGLAGRFADATPRDLQVTGSVPVASGPDKTVVPDDAIGVLVNVTVVTPSHEGFLSLRPEGAAGEPTTSTVNFFPGAIEPNGATVDLNNGKIQIWVETSSDSGSADVLIDVVGYTIGHTHDDRYYTETESDAAVAAAVAPKANSADVYTKTEVDTTFIPYDGVIPPGTTVIGAWATAPSTDATGSLGFSEITLPAMASAPLSGSDINMGAGTTNGTDNDATCTGTDVAPTAPPGTLCFYVGFQTGLTGLAGFSSNGDVSRSAAVRVVGGPAAGSKYARGSWAYTAPASGAAATRSGTAVDAELGNDATATSGG